MKAKLLIVMSLCALMPLGCGKGPGAVSLDGQVPPHQKGIAIKGTFAAGLTKEMAGAGARALDPSLVANVAVFTGTSGFFTTRVTNGSFNVLADSGQPVGMVFVGTAGDNLGYLSLGNGMESIPLNMVDSGVSTIDLQTLTSSGNVIEPGHNPVGTDISMTSSDITSYVFSNGALGSVVKSPDVDGDGIVDVMSGTYYLYTVAYDVRAGNFGSGLTPTLASPIVIGSYTLQIKIFDKDLDFPSSVFFRGPAGSGLDSATSWMVMSNGSDMREYFAPFIANPPTPPAGAYIVSYKTKTLTFNLLDQTRITQYLALPVPTAELNSDSTIHRISWEYRLSDGSATIDPRALIADVILQITIDVGNGPPGAQVYSSANLPSSATEDIPAKQDIQWEKVLNISTSYHDVFGNTIGVEWARP
jgi:hypothetical protein